MSLEQLSLLLGWNNTHYHCVQIRNYNSGNGRLMKQKTASASFTHKLLPFLLRLVSHPPKHSRADSLPLLSFQRSLLWTSPVFHPHSSSFRVFYSHPSLLLNKKPGYFPEAAELLLFCFKCYRFLAIKVQPPKKCQFRPELHILNDNIVKQSKTKKFFTF